MLDVDRSSVTVVGGGDCRMLDTVQRNVVPASQQANFIKVLETYLAREQEDGGVSPETAFLLAGVRLFGFDPEDGFVTDGPKDYGFDYVHITGDDCTIFQAKSVAYANGIDTEFLIGPQYLDDLRQIQQVLQHLDDVPPDCNRQVDRALTLLRNEISRRALQRLAKSDDWEMPTYSVTIMLLALGKTLSGQAQTEFNMMSSSSFEYAGVRVDVTIVPVFIDDLLNELWAQRNHDWKDRKGTKKDRFNIRVVGDVIKDSKTAIFYARAYDFVEAFGSLGYQIFEPNVRSEIKDSKVNRAIKETVSTREGRRDFRHLNNGITVICEGYSVLGPKDKPTGFEPRKPGIVNGLQTVKSLHDAYRRLKHAEQIDFQENCLVLCRLHQEGSVRSIDDLIKATNNQNPMKPRNLRSNDPEQRAFESLFSELGWFYERKEGSWNAFMNDPRGWKSLGGKRAEHFSTKGKGHRKVDNAQVAQNWLAFIGFSTEAINEKRMLFAEDHLYSLVFLRRTVKHGFDYDFKLTRDSAVFADSQERSPDPSALLLAHLTREVADYLAPSRKENRDRAIKALGLENRSRDEQDRELDIDPNYQKGKMLRGMLTLFVEFVGFTLYRALGDEVHIRAGHLLSLHSFKPIYEQFDFEPLVTRYTSRNFLKDDLIVILFSAFEHCVGALYDSNWLRGYNDAPVKNKYIYSVRTRKQLLEELIELDKRFGRSEMVRDWADGFNEAKGIFNFVRKLL